MFYELMLARRDGKVIPRHELGETYLRGLLTVRERHVVDLGRHSRVATFSAAGVHDLYDVTLLHTDSSGYLVLTGFEHRTDLPGRPVDFAQTWILRFSGDQRPLASVEEIMRRARDTAAA